MFDIGCSVLFEIPNRQNIENGVSSIFEVHPFRTSKTAATTAPQEAREDMLQKGLLRCASLHFVFMVAGN